MRLVVHGATGRMGLAVARLAEEAGDVRIVGAVASPDDPKQGRDLGEIAGIGNLGVSVMPDVASALLGADVVIDFSIASALRPLLAVAAKNGVAVVTGTTNLDADTLAALDRAAERIPVLWAPNMSLGVQVLAELVEQAVRRLGPGFDAEIVEIHHRRKIDSPSGTAKRLADAVRAARPNAVAIHGRDGDVGKRTDDEIAVLGVRGGDVIGDHTVFLLGNGERLELTHRASNRDLFAQGAIRAARFLRGKKNGRYSISDALG
ncbi:MAG TPA: 4-hydroxy-tetrahydrodipicolinate reductase [Polyangiaceae bacterium]|jgi:4-hydroxy-tetrahydrodipicolinate reductase|nr:4-hydroxy-tetrahydrodipicolinate reductase [Polyangiaceae bacterium]